MMNVLVLNPPAVDQVRIVREGRCMQRQEAWGTSWAPLTLAIISAMLRNNGFGVQLKDCSNDGISFDQLKNIIINFKPGLIIVNTSTPSIKSDLTVATLVKELDPGIKTIFFGIHVTALPEEVFGLNRDVDYLVKGEPEFTLLDFARAVRENTPIEIIPGLVYRKNGEIVFNEDRPFIEDLDVLPYPAWDLVNMPGYKLPITNRPFLLVLISRGCPYPCTFCAASCFYGKKTRLRSPKKIVDEMKYVVEHFGIYDFLFWAENATMDHQHMLAISQGLARDVKGVRWVCNGRVDNVDENLLLTMKAAGCWMIGYGIEAGTQRVLNLMKKNISVQDMEHAVCLAKKAGLEVTGHVIVGYPGETKDDILATSRLVRKLDLDYIQVYCCVPFPGSEIYKEAKEKGYINTQDWAMFEQNFSVLDTPQLSSQDVMAMRAKIVEEFYLNPKKIFRHLMKIKNFEQFKFFLSFAFRYFSNWVKKR